MQSEQSVPQAHTELSSADLRQLVDLLTQKPDPSSFDYEKDLDETTKDLMTDFPLTGLFF